MPLEVPENNCYFKTEVPDRHLNTDTYKTRGYDYDYIWRKNTIFKT